MQRGYKAALVASSIAISGIGLTHDQTNAAPLDVTATIDVVCDITVASNLGFGTVDSSSNGESVTNASFTLSNCDGGSTDVTIDSGGNFADSSRNLLRDGGSETVAYSMEEIGNSLGPWAPGEAKTLQLNQGDAITLTLQGQLDTVDVGNAPGGDYADQVQVTVAFTPTP